MAGDAAVFEVQVTCRRDSSARRGASRVGVKGEFNLATCNVLGNDHTMGRGRKRGFGSGAVRMRLTVNAFRSHDVDVSEIVSSAARSAFAGLSERRRG